MEGSKHCFPSQVSEQDAPGRRSEVEFQPSLRCIPAISAAREPRRTGWERTRLAGAGETVSCYCQRAAGGGGRRDSRRLRSAKPGRAGSAAPTLRPWPGRGCLRSALPFRPRASPRHGSPAAVRRGTGQPRVRLARPGRLPGHPKPKRPSPFGARTNFLPPGPRARLLAGSSVSRLPQSVAAGALARHGELPPCPSPTPELREGA